jgi:nitrogen fixation NifU-like protein
MYQEALLAHHRAPHNKREIPTATTRASYKNPVCGDEITVMLVVSNDVIDDAAFSGRGCSIATASASMMTEVLRGRSTGDAQALTDSVERMLGGAPVDLPDALTPLRGVAPFAGRHGCARLPWQALRDALAGMKG